MKRSKNVCAPDGNVKVVNDDIDLFSVLTGATSMLQCVGGGGQSSW